MDLSFTDDQQRYRNDVRKWISANLPARWAGLFRGPGDDAEYAAFQRDWEARLYRAGYAGVAWPRDYGGQGLGMIEHLIVAEELGRAAAPEGINFTGTELVGPLLLAVGTEDQKRRYIPRILAAEEIWCQGFSEPDAGSDLASLRTVAVREDGEWMINGQKVWTSNAAYSDWCLLLARTDPTAAKHKGLSILIVPMKASGITVRPLRQINGRGDFNEVFFDNVRVPEDAHIGSVNDGWNTANNVLSVERGTNRLYRQARFEHEFRHLLRTTMDIETRDGGKAVSESWYRQRLAACYINLAVHRAQNLKVISRIVNGDGIGTEVSLVKALWAVSRQKTAALGLDLLGSDAAVEESDAIEGGRFQDLYLTARADTIYAGTLEIQKNIIAERLLGLPR